ncbi:flavodoxin family protein [Desulfatitalea tepidiphila]|uniref:flavodoxin family protein n=1 Tax=Desulfatitalea tepidiphila TaxID=1185843 RepID=UPI0006B51B7C|nr:flavodoxin family protein [Desulfatitalea tepidiphila]
MHVLAINGSPRKTGNTSTLIHTMLDGAREAGAETTEAHLHTLDMKGCMGCLSCRTRHGICAQKDGLSTYLEMMKTCDAVVIGCPIYMYRICGQMKLFVDRLYSLYPPKAGGGYLTAVPPGKRFALVISQGAPDAEQYQRSIRWLAGMAGTGLGIKEVGRIVHADSHVLPAGKNRALIDEAHAIGRKLVE